MTARADLEEGALLVAQELNVSHSHSIASLEKARLRALEFNWVNAVGDYQCPECWVTDERKSPLLPAASMLPTEAHFECPDCRFHFVEQS